MSWVFSLLFIFPDGSLREYDTARFESKEACMVFLNGTGWKRTVDEYNGRLIERSCRKVHYEP